MTQNLIGEAYRLQNEDIRPGNSPSDMLAVIRNETGSSTTVSVPFKPGTVVYVAHLVPLTVGGTVATPTLAVTGGADGQKALILGKSLNQQL